MADIDDFNPPYHFGAFGCVLVGVWDTAPEPAPSGMPRGLEPMRWRGGYLGMALLLRYVRPSEAHPVVYNEIIGARAFRRGLRSAAVPFDLVLDDAFNVEAGKRYYHLPKRLDPTLRIDLEVGPGGKPERMTVSGADTSFYATLGAASLPRTTGFVARFFQEVTKRAVIIGAAPTPPLEMVVELRPDPATARSARIERFTMNGRMLSPLYAHFWSSIDITLGAPIATPS